MVAYRLHMHEAAVRHIIYGWWLIHVGLSTYITGNKSNHFDLHFLQNLLLVS